MFPLVTIPSTRYPSASALLVDDSFQLFIKILRGHIQGMFVYTPPSWHPVLCCATPSRPGRAPEEERPRRAQRGVSFTGPPRRSPSLISGGSAPLASPRNPPLAWVREAEIGRKRPRDVPRVAAIWCLSPPPAVPPTHKFTHSWSRASSMLWELKPNDRLITPPRGHAAVCEQEPKEVCRNPVPSTHEAIPSRLQPRPFCTPFGFFAGYERTLQGKQLQHQELDPDDCPQWALDALQPQKALTQNEGAQSSALTKFRRSSFDRTG